jgi:dihydrodipicolinate synthase/N-acetylneuraminate lyase
LRQHLCGALAALPTPMDAAGALDLDGLRAHVGFQLEHQVSALVVGGSIGEASSLSVEERRALAETCVRAVDGRAQVIVSVTHDHLASSLELMGHATEAGADGLLVSVPPFFKLTAAEQSRFWEQINAHTKLPIIVYCSGHGATPRPTIDELAKVVADDAVVAIKEASPDVARIEALVAAFQPTVPVIVAGEKTLVDAAATGAVAAMTASVCFAPSRIATVLEKAHAGDVAGARETFAPVQRFRSAFQAEMDAGYPSYIAYTKAACEIIGLPAGPPRPPLAPLSEEERDRIRDAVRAAR